MPADLYRAFHTSNVSVDQVVKSLKKNKKIEVRHGKPYPHILFAVSESGETLDPEYSDDRSPQGSRYLIYECNFKPGSISGAPLNHEDALYDMALGIDGGIIGIPNMKMLDAIKSIVESATPGGKWVQSPSTGWLI